MGKYIGPKQKFGRRAGGKDGGFKIRSLESGSPKRCNVLPGGGPKTGGGRVSNFGAQMNEKQWLRRIFGLREGQFKRCYQEAARRQGVTGSILLQLLESRLDNVVYRMGYAVTRAQARQLVSHRAIEVNGRVVNVASFSVSPGDEVKVRKPQVRVQDALQLAQERGLPDWVRVDPVKMHGVFERLPEREEVLLDINENAIVEFYSK
jgi:small subunit ribosomal protein S4